MAFWSNWPDGTKWLMGIVSALIVSAIIALASQLWRPERPVSSEQSPAPADHSPAVTPAPSTVKPVPAVVPPPDEAPVQVAAASPATDSAPNQGDSVQSDTRNGVRIDLLGCQISASRVTCRAIMTQAREGYNHVLGGSDGSYIWDMQGNQYSVSRVRLGAQEGKRRAVIDKLPANTPTRVELVFEGVSSELGSIKTLLIATYQENFTFQDIGLSR